MKTLELLPAVDIAQGYAVRPVAGNLDPESSRLDPVQAALDWVAAGTRWIHLVDLDLAYGRGTNTPVLAEVIRAVREQNPQVKIQVSGGIKNQQALDIALSLAPDRINVTSAALADPEWLSKILAEHGELLALGLDARWDESIAGYRAVARGTDWQGGTLEETIAWLNNQQVHRYIVTDVSRDGALSGTGFDLLGAVAQHTSAPLVASGGVASLEEIERLRELEQVEGLVLGKALYAGRFSLPLALVAAGF